MPDHPTSDRPAPDVRRDEGGWISGPMPGAPQPARVLPPPPGSTAHRELLTTIARALELPPPATLAE